MTIHLDGRARPAKFMGQMELLASQFTGPSQRGGQQPRIAQIAVVVRSTRSKNSASQRRLPRCFQAHTNIFPRNRAGRYALSGCERAPEDQTKIGEALGLMTPGPFNPPRTTPGAGTRRAGLGIEPGYGDTWCGQQSPRPKRRRAIPDALGVAVGSRRNSTAPSRTG